MEAKNYKLVFNEEFSSSKLNTDNWIPFYLPQWSSREKSKPDYEIKDGLLSLQISENQKPWCPEFNGKVKCSSIQTGVFAGKLGSDIGQHKFFNPKCVVREEQESEQKYVPQYGYFEMRARFAATKSDVVALWMIGFEDTPEKSAELCIVEIKGWNIKKRKAKIGMGIHKFNDPKLTEDFSENECKIDVTEFHVYAVEWTKEKIVFSIDHIKVKEIDQSPDYPMQFMLGIYEIPEKISVNAIKTYPKRFIVDYVRGYENFRSLG
ncbi:glycoside hydrolase family 16 protein [Ferruginibacter sp.]|nr:glycoside hydrolase family 16 protein [Ferruginibacter sp.]